MDHWTTQDLLQATGGTLIHHGRRSAFKGIRIDSRSIPAESVFVAIEGAVHDGHKFIGDVLQQGVQGLVVKNENAGSRIGEIRSHGATCIAVENTTAALGALAAYHRRRCGVKTVAITGSNGKTTTRCMTAAVFQQHGPTLATVGNRNNEIGVPLTLFRLNPDHQWAVLELGMNHPGEIRRLGRICRPHIGVITNIGPAHLEGLGSMAGVLRAKAELLETMEDDGVAVLNADDRRLLALSGKTSARTILFGLSEAADVRAVRIETAPDRTRFELQFGEHRVRVTLGIPGRFMVSNALAAAAAGFQAGISPEEIRKGLEEFKPETGRMHVIRTDRNFFIMDDTYNANPASMAAALDTLSQVRGRGRGILVVGDMRELGAQAEMRHRDLGRKAAKSGVALIYATGDFAQAMAEGAVAENFDESKIFTGSHEQILQDLMPRLQESDWVLIKGSRAMEMEKIVAGLRDGSGNRQPSDAVGRPLLQRQEKTT